MCTGQRLVHVKEKHTNINKKESNVCMHYILIKFQTVVAKVFVIN